MNCKQSISGILLTLLVVSYAQAGVMFSDGFENGMGNWTQVYGSGSLPTMTTVTQDPEGDSFYAHSGSNMVSDYDNRWYASNMSHDMGADVAGTVTFAVGWNFRVDYGTTAMTKQAYVEIVGDDGFALFGNFRNPNYPADSRNNYLGYRVYDKNGDSGEILTNIALTRDTWYEAKFVVDSTGIKGYWDGQLIFSNLSSGGFNTLKSIDFGTNYGTDPVTSATVNAMLVDDVIVTPEPATLIILSLGGLLLRRKIQ